MKKALRFLLMTLSVVMLASCAANSEGTAGIRSEGDPASLFQTVCAADDALELSKNADVVVLEGMRCISGSEVWDVFCRAADSGSPACVLCAQYYTLDREQMSEELYEEEKDRYPKLYFCLVEYDGEEYAVRIRESTEEATDYQETFRHLLHFIVGPAPAAASDAAYEYYVLADDPSATWEGILGGIVSSQSGAGYKHCIVYRDVVDSPAAGA